MMRTRKRSRRSLGKSRNGNWRTMKSKATDQPGVIKTKSDMILIYFYYVYFQKLIFKYIKIIIKINLIFSFFKHLLKKTYFIKYI